MSKKQWLYLAAFVAITVTLLSVTSSFLLLRKQDLYTYSKATGEITKIHGMTGTEVCDWIVINGGETSAHACLFLGDPVTAMRLAFGNNVPIDLKANPEAARFSKEVLDNAPDQFETAFSNNLTSGEIMYFDSDNLVKSHKR